jgi:hypothetical protein
MKDAPVFYFKTLKKMEGKEDFFYFCEKVDTPWGLGMGVPLLHVRAERNPIVQ